MFDINSFSFLAPDILKGKSLLSMICKRMLTPLTLTILAIENLSQPTII
jgi:hypothetical protein